MGNDLSIVNSARLSFNQTWKTGTDEGSDFRLLKYLYTHEHMTPFESVELSFEVKAPIFIARQWMRHRTFSYNEVSGRYTELPDEFYIPWVGLGIQDKSNKQGRILSDVPSAQEQEYIEYMAYTAEECFRVYKFLLSKNVPREIARTVLPLSTYTVFRVKGNLRNFLHFLDLRLDPHSQYEIRVYAEAMKTLMEEVIPETMKLYDEYRT